MTTPTEPSVLIPRRPRVDDLDVRLAAVESKWPDVAAWLKTEGESDEEIIALADRTKSMIAAALEHGDGGYDVCRTLERDGWSPDDDLVAIMGIIAGRRHDALLDAEKAWVAANDIRPAFDVGDRVSIAKRPGRTDARVDGEITTIYRARGAYCVFCESLGHVRHGNGSYGRIVNYEDVYPVGTPDTAAPEDPA